MEQPALREVERRRQWQDKIEVRLDNRQVFFLFFGSAVVACMLFVLGVLVGKRIESRGRAEAPEVQDPLAVLDRANPTAPAASPPAPVAELTFPNKLMAPAAKAKPAPAPPKPVAAAPRPAVAPPKPAVVAAPAPPKPAAAPKPAAKGKFTLHLANFTAKEEADAFARKFAGQGAFVVASEVPEKGTVYRVRCGNYATLQDATTAKAAFEKQNKVIAFVAAR